MDQPSQYDMQAAAVLQRLSNVLDRDDLRLASTVVGARRLELADRQEVSLGVDQEATLELAEATVCSLLPDFQHVELETANGYSLCIGSNVAGLDWRELVEGDRLICLFQGRYASRVLFAKLVSRGHS